jgi:hypothetical protein
MAVWLPSWLATASDYPRIPQFDEGPTQTRGQYPGLGLVLLAPYLKKKSCLCFTASIRGKSFTAVSVLEILALILEISVQCAGHGVLPSNMDNLNCG